MQGSWTALLHLTKGLTMNWDLIIPLATIALVYCGYRIGFEAGKVEGRIEQFQANR